MNQNKLKISVEKQIGLVRSVARDSDNQSSVRYSHMLGKEYPSPLAKNKKILQAQRKKAPLNPVRRREYDEEQQLVRAIFHEDERAGYHRLRRAEVKQREAVKRKRKLQQKIWMNAKKKQKRREKFAKKFAVQKAAEVIQLIERMAMRGAKVGSKQKVMDTIVDNLMAKHKDKPREKEYWSMQLLSTLGLVPQPEESDTDLESVNLSIHETSNRLKDLGVSLTGQQLAELNPKLEKIAGANQQELVKIPITVEERVEMKFKPKDLEALRDLGLTDEEILAMDVADNPFKDKALDKLMPVAQFEEEYKVVLEGLEVAYKEDFEAKREAGDADSEHSESQVYTGIEPASLPKWGKSKRLHYEKVKLEQQKIFYFEQRQVARRHPHKVKFLLGQDEDTLTLVDQMMQKRVIDKKAEIFDYAAGHDLSLPRQKTRRKKDDDGEEGTFSDYTDSYDEEDSQDSRRRSKEQFGQRRAADQSKDTLLTKSDQS